MRRSNMKQHSGDRRVHNNLAETKHNPIKHYIGFIELDGKEYIIPHECKFRVQAIDYFESFARYNGAKFTGRLNVVNK